MKLNVLLAKTEHSASQFKKAIEDYISFFKGEQGQFRGYKKTYSPRPDTIDLPSERGVIKVVTTVREKLDWFEERQKDFIDNLFSVEATNASNVARAELVVDGVSWGTFSSLELLRLKSLIESGKLEEMYSKIPVRPDEAIWERTTEEMYQDREIYAQPMISGIKKSVTKESHILADPNVQYLKDTSKYQPQVATKDSIVELGDYTVQAFSGEYTHRQRAEILKRRSILLEAVITALKKANEVETIPSSLTAERLFNYLHRGE